jgi:hypothetical protein
MRMAATVIAVKIYDRLCLSNMCILNPFKFSCFKLNPSQAFSCRVWKNCLIVEEI